MALSGLQGSNLRQNCISALELNWSKVSQIDLRSTVLVLSWDQNSNDTETFACKSAIYQEVD